MILTPQITFAGDLLNVHFDDFGINAYPMFLKVKALPESRVEFNRHNATYTISAPARFAPMLGVNVPDELSPGHIFGGENDCGRPTARGIYIYALIDPFTNEIRYIGKSTRPRERLANHCNERSACHRCHWIQSLITRGARPLMLILERLDIGSDWQTVERDWIAFARERGWPLTNGTDGGDGVCNLSPESRERISAAWRGRKHSAESLVKIGAASRGRRHSEANKARVSTLLKNREFSAEHRAKISKAVRKVDEATAETIRARLAAGELIVALSAELGIERTTLRKIRDRKGCYAPKGSQS